MQCKPTAGSSSISTVTNLYPYNYCLVGIIKTNYLAHDLTKLFKGATAPYRIYQVCICINVANRWL
jgi:hypothetical protein